MESSDATAVSQQKSHGLTRACLAVAACGALTWILAPRGLEADYAGTGLLLAPTNYGLLLPLLGFGAATADLDALLIIETMALFAAGLAASAAMSEDLLLTHQDALSFVVRYPVTNCAMALCAGAALLTGGRLKAIPVAMFALLMGGALGLTIGLYSPGDDQARWFVIPAAIAGTMVVLVAASLASKVAAPWWAIARNILGSWLIATGVLLAGFPLVPKKQESVPAVEAPAPQSNAGRDTVEFPQSSAPQIPGSDPARQP